MNEHGNVVPCSFKVRGGEVTSNAIRRGASKAGEVRGGKGRRRRVFEHFQLKFLVAPLIQYPFVLIFSFVFISISPPSAHPPPQLPKLRLGFCENNNTYAGLLNS